MLEVDRNILWHINNTFKGKELEAMLEAWKRWPTFKTDCNLKRQEKEYKRKQYAKRYLEEKEF